jgi:outer membrane lipoprotein SlyB
MENAQTLPSSSLWAIPRAVWIGAAAFGIAAASAGAAMWLQPQKATAEVATTAGALKDTKAAAVKPAPKAAQVAAAPACQSCGVVESVRTYQRKGEGSGVGAVAGGVVGAVVGNQFGKGNGRSAMTVIGAVGGGVAGNEIEKRSKSVTVTEVRVRMDDGTLRTFEPKVVPNAGDRVMVQGQSLQPAPHQGG